MKRWTWLAIAAATGACSFPTSEFTLGGGGADVPGNDTGRVDAGSPDAPAVTDLGAPDAPAIDAPTDSGPADAADAPTADAADAGAGDTGGDAGAPVDSPCAAGRVLCGADCVDPLTDGLHCGRCNYACNATNATSAACVAGRCETTCRTGFADCDTDPRNGCEVGLGTITNCRACADVCPAGAAPGTAPACTANVCGTTCATGFGDCNGNAADGCERPTATDALNCGACGAVCRAHPGSPAVCAAGACAPVCNAGYGNCDGNLVNGCEASLATNLHCGGCNRPCAAGTTCRAGACAAGATPNYTRTSLAAAFVDVCALPAALHLLPSTDDGGALTPLPFAFTYWGVALPAGAMVNVSSNGFVSLEASMQAGTQGLIPDPVAPNGVIAAWWVDLRTPAGGVCVATVGAAPSRRFVVQWGGANNYATSAGDMNFEVILNEGTNTVDVLYQRLVPPPPGYAPTVGIESIAGTQANVVCSTANPTCGVAAGSGFRYTPQ
jgi:hypothetical protein